jgi:hypothetical protein
VPLVLGDLDGNLLGDGSRLALALVPVRIGVQNRINLGPTDLR